VGNFLPTQTEQKGLAISMPGGFKFGGRMEGFLECFFSAGEDKGAEPFFGGGEISGVDSAVFGPGVVNPDKVVFVKPGKPITYRPVAYGK